MSTGLRTTTRNAHFGRRLARCPQWSRPRLESLEGRLAPTVTLSVSDPAPFPKPDSGQILGMFVATRAGDPGPAVQVDYRTQDGSGANGAHAGVDYVATSGTLYFAPNQMTATIAVPILGNNIFQPDKTLTVTLSNPQSYVGGLAPQQTFRTGSYPSAVAVGDFNGDGKPDLAVVNSSSGTVSVLLNTTPAGATIPRFALQQTFNIGSHPVSIAVGDFNGDGEPDLAVVWGSSVSVLLNTTPAGATLPSFAPPQSFVIGSRPEARSVAVGDFNGDGKPDLAVVDEGDIQIPGTVSVLLNTTPRGATIPSFIYRQTFATGRYPSSVAVGDFNGDGKPDLAIVNSGSDSVSVLLNTTPTGATIPNFAPQQTFDAGANPWPIAVGDFNGDGKPDLAVARAAGLNDVVSVLMNTTLTGATTVSFAPRQTFDSGPDPLSVAVGDFNGDGKADLAVGTRGSFAMPDATVSVLLNIAAVGATTPSFSPKQTFDSGSGPDAVAVGDFNGDGKPDLAVANGGAYQNGTTVSVLLNDWTRIPITLNGSSATGTILEDDAPMSITVVAGSTPQSTVVDTPFATPLAVDVRNAAGNLVRNVSVTFAAPASGASGQFGNSNAATVVTNATGRAIAPRFVANTNPGNYLVTAQAAGGSSPSTNFSLTNTPGAPATVTATMGSSQSATVTTAFTVNLLATVTDQYGNVVPGVTVTFTAPVTGASATFPSGNTGTTDSTGQVSKAFVANTVAGTYTIRAAASGGSNPIATFVSLTNAPALLSKLGVAGYPSPATAGIPNTFTVTAQDPYGNTVSGYLGTVHFTSTDPRANLPAAYTFSAADNSTHVFAAVLKTAGGQSLTATDTRMSSIYGTQGGIAVQPAAATTLVVVGFPSPVTAGAASTFSITARDTYGNTAINYAGRVSFSSTDPQAELPASYTFTPSDNGTHIFGGVLLTAGVQALTVTDIANGSITGTQPGIVVNPAPPDHLAITTQVNSTVAGIPFDVTVTVQDPFNNTLTGYTGTVTFASADPFGASLPADYTFQPGDHGMATFSGGATLYTAGTWDVTATDTTSGVTGTALVNVQAAPAVAFQVLAAANAVSGTPFDVSLIAVDPYGNTDTNYQGTVTWTTTDPDAGVQLPADYSFRPGDRGMVTFAGGVTLVTPGDQVITATDTADPTITGSATVAVSSPGPDLRRQLPGRSAQADVEATRVDQLFADLCQAESGALGSPTHDRRATGKPWGLSWLREQDF